MFTGRAWYASGTSDNGAVRPFTGDNAHAVARALGLTIRTNDRQHWGTTLVIVGFDANMDELRKGIEDYWWPRINEDDLQVELCSDEEQLDRPKPRQRDDLKPFQQSYDLARGIAQPVSASERRQDLAYLGTRLGSWGAVAVEVRDRTDSDENEELSDQLNTVALIRSPRMVVQYYRPSYRGALPAFAATFIATGEANTVLKLSEPPTHNHWDRKSDRLKNIPHGAEFVEQVLRRLHQSIRRFLADLVPPAPPRDGHLHTLERELGQLLRKFRRIEPPQPPPRSEDAIRIEALEPNFHGSDGVVVVSWEVLFHLNENVNVDERRISARFRLPLLADDNQAEEDEIPIRLEALTPGVTLGEDNGASFAARKDGMTRIRVTSAPYDASWLTELVISTEPVDA
jgi:hypothetical protein